jgi:hypothetical protein
MDERFEEEVERPALAIIGHDGTSHAAGYLAVRTTRVRAAGNRRPAVRAAAKCVAPSVARLLLARFAQARPASS